MLYNFLNFKLSNIKLKCIETEDQTYESSAKELVKNIVQYYSNMYRIKNDKINKTEEAMKSNFMSWLLLCDLTFEVKHKKEIDRKRFLENDFLKI
jgi:hypothetical protein